MRCLLNGLLHLLLNYINETITISDLSGCKRTRSWGQNEGEASKGEFILIMHGVLVPKNGC